MTTTVSGRILAAAAAGSRRIALTFADGTQKTVDVRPLLKGPAFSRLAVDDGLFAQLYVDPVLRTVCWPGGLDLAPEALAALADVSE